MFGLKAVNAKNAESRASVLTNSVCRWRPIYRRYCSTLTAYSKGVHQISAACALYKRSQVVLEPEDTHHTIIPLGHHSGIVAPRRQTRLSHSRQKAVKRINVFQTREMVRAVIERKWAEHVNPGGVVREVDPSMHNNGPRERDRWYHGDDLDCRSVTRRSCLRTFLHTTSSV